jgi:membrane-bound metal-dependent hydrolase YbcI (DUF457 family)
MKGVTHFAVGLAAASCFPEAVAAGGAGNPLYFILGGLFGLLPDTLDFKLYRFLHRHDIEVTPDPLRPDTKQIARAVALAVQRAQDSGEPVRIKLNTVRVAADAWQAYSVRFDRGKREVAVRLGPIVDTGGNPIPNRPGPRPGRAGASAPLPADVSFDYQAQTTIDIFDGPTFRMSPRNDGVQVDFIPWHRQWSHSLVLALLFGLAGGLVWGITAGYVIAAAFAAHIAVDQLGFMGSNLWFPFTKRRSRGLMLGHASEALPNATAVWLSCLVIFWNLSRGAGPGVARPGVVPLFLYAGALPLLCARLLRRVTSDR